MVDLKEIVSVIVDDCKAAVSKHIHSNEGLRNLIHNELDKMKKTSYEGDTSVILDRFAVVDKDGNWLADGEFEFCANFLAGSKTNPHLKQSSVKHWKIIRTTRAVR